MKQKEETRRDTGIVSSVDAASPIGAPLKPGEHAQSLVESIDYDDRGKRSQAGILLSYCSGVELFHTPEQVAYGSFPVKSHFENYPINSQKARDWLRGVFYRHTRKAVSTQSLQDVIDVLSARALHDGPEVPVFLRIAEQNQTIFVDLGTPDWSAVEVDRSGFRIVSKSPVKFRRSKHALPLPLPTHVTSGNVIEKLKRFLNYQSEDDFKMFVAFLLNCFNPGGPFLVLILYGEQGSAKSTTVRILRALTDPNTQPLRGAPRDTDSLFVQVISNHVIAIDNLSYLKDELSDDLCRVATGGGISKRKHYSNDEEVVLEGKRPIILNGIEEFVARGDLASRSIVIDLPVIKDRRREKKLDEEFRESAPEILGAILNGISAALATRHDFELEDDVRMTDAWHFISAAEMGIGWPRGTCLDAFKRNRLKANDVVLHSSPLSPFVLSLAKPGWRGSPTELLSKLNLMRNADGASYTDERSWPSNPKNLTDRLKRLAPALRIAGVDVRREQTPGNNSERLIVIRKLP